MTLATTPRPPYYAVIFSSELSSQTAGYGELAEQMVELAERQPGFLGMESVRDTDGTGITVSYWSTRESITAWKRNSEHLIAQRLGRTKFYRDFRLRIALVESETFLASPE